MVKHGTAAKSGAKRQNLKRIRDSAARLDILEKAVERMGGWVGVESSLGRGSTFWL